MLDFPGQGRDFKGRTVSRTRLAAYRLAILSISMLGCGGGSAGNSTTPPPPLPANGLGIVTKSAQVSCSAVGAGGGTQSATCYQLTVSCPSVADEDMTVKVNYPAGSSSLGTVLFTIG